MSTKLIRLHRFTQEACGPSTSKTQALEVTSGEMDAANALMRLLERLQAWKVSHAIHFCTWARPVWSKPFKWTVGLRHIGKPLFLKNDSDVQAFTGVESLQLLEGIAEAVSEKDILKTERCVFERVVLALVWLKTFLSFKCLATLFGVSVTTVHRYFYSTLRAWTAVMESVVPWPTKEDVQQNEPHCFAAYTYVRIVLDCTEVEVEKSHCASCRILTYSHYKGVYTLKVLIGVSPGALITFVSERFGGRASDKACVEDIES